jgi:hypothetical protein
MGQLVRGCGVQVTLPAWTAIVSILFWVIFCWCSFGGCWNTSTDNAVITVVAKNIPNRISNAKYENQMEYSGPSTGNEEYFCKKSNTTDKNQRNIPR